MGFKSKVIGVLALVLVASLVLILSGYVHWDIAGTPVGMLVGSRRLVALGEWGWTTYSLTGNWILTSGGRYNGSQAVELSRQTGPGVHYAYKEVSVNDSLYLALWDRGDSNYGNTYSVEVRDTTNNLIEVLYSSSNASWKWTHRIFNLTKYSNSTIRVFLSVNTSEGPGVYRFDDVVLSRETPRAPCVTPTDGMAINSNTTFCEGTYSLPSGVRVTANNIALNCSGAVLVGNGSGDGISIQADGVTVTYCNVTNYSTGIGSASGSEYCVIAYNRVYNSTHGIDLTGSSHNTNISCNVVYYISSYAIAAASNNNTVSGNTVYESGFGVIFGGTSSLNNTVSGNTIWGNTANGILVRNGANNNTVYNNTVYYNTNGIYIHDVNNTVVYDNSLSSISGNGVYMSSTQGNRVYGNTVYNSTENGVYLTQSSDNTLYNNTVWNNTGQGIYLTSSSSNNVTGNNLTGNTVRGILLQGGNSNQLIDNTIYDNLDNGIRLDDSNDTTITGNTVYNNVHVGIDLYSNNHNNVLTGNTVHNTTGNGIQLTFSNSNNTLAGNTVYDNANGINIVSSDSTNVTENNVTDNTDYGVRLLGSNSSIVYHNSIYGNTAGQVYSNQSIELSYNNQGNWWGRSSYPYFTAGTDSNDENVTDSHPYTQSYGGGEWPAPPNIVTPTDGMTISVDTLFVPGTYSLPNGITISASNIALDCNNAVLVGNTSSRGIMLSYKTGVTVRNCVVYNYSDGIHLGGASNNTVANNTLYWNSGYGIYLGDADNNNLTGNTVYNNTGHGILLNHCNGNTLTDNTAYEHSSTNGIELLSSSNNTLTGNTAYNNSGTGIRLEPFSHNNTLTSNIAYNNGGGITVWTSDDNTLTNNTVYDNSDEGITLTSSNSVLTGNTVYGNGQTGIALYASSTSNTITDNTVYNNSQNGIYLYFSNNNTVTNNTVYNNTNRGVYLTNSNNTLVSGNTLYDNIHDGIWLTDSNGGNVTGNNITGNTEYGINLWSSNSSIVYHNSIYDNNGWPGNVQVNSDQPIELSYSSQGNWWGRSSYPYFIAGTDSNDADVVDSYAYTQSYSPGSWPTDNCGYTDWWPMFRHDSNHTGYSETSVSVNDFGLTWNYTTGNIVRSSPAVADGIVYIGSDDKKAYALNTSTGEHIWNYTAGGIVRSSPAVADGIVYIGSDDSRLYALNASTGEHLWNYSTNSWIRSSPAASNGIVYAASEDSRIYALNAMTGVQVWNYTTGDMFTSSPAVSGGVVYAASEDSRIYALNASNGNHRWNYSTGDAIIRSSPAVAGGIVYVGSEDNKLYALNSSDGSLVWGYTTESNVQSSPAIADGIVYVGGGGGVDVYAFNASNGDQIWNATVGGVVQSSPAVADGIVLIGSGDNKTYALNASSGSVVWNYTTGGSIYSSPAVADGMLYIGSSDGIIYGFGATTTSTTTTTSSTSSTTSTTLAPVSGTYLASNVGTVRYSFLSGTLANLTVMDYVDAIGLNTSRDRGLFTSQVFDAGSNVSWNNVSWASYAGELPNYGQSMPKADMTGNILLLHMNEDGVNGTTIADYSSSKGSNGTLALNSLSQNATASGRFNTALSFDGVDDYIEVPALGMVDNLTIETWVYVNQFSGFGVIRNDEGWSAGDVHYQFNENRLGFSISGGGSVDPENQDFDYTFETGRWYHLVTVYSKDGKFVGLYVDGSVQQQKNYTSTISPTLGAAWIGGWDGGSRWFNGSIDEFAVYNRTLSATEIMDRYRRGVLRLNLSVRSCDDASCDGESFVPVSNPSPQVLGVTDNQYFQYTAAFETDNASYTPELYNVTVEYTLNCTTPTDGMTINSDTLLCPGTYNLSSGVDIEADSITLDCDNAVLVGNLSTACGGPFGCVGIEVMGRNNTVIRSCHVTNYPMGVLLQDSSHNTIQDNTIYSNVRAVPEQSNGIGLRVNGGYDNTVLDNVFANNSDQDIEVVDTALNNFTGNNITGNGSGTASGVRICGWVGAAGNIFSNNLFWNNSVAIATDGIVYNNTIFNNTIWSNSLGGIHMSDNYSNTVSYNTLTENAGETLYISGDNKRILYNTIYNNDQLGISLSSSNNNLVVGNVIYSNAQQGIYISSSSGNNVTENNITGNSGEGINLQDSNSSIVYWNSIYGNDPGGGDTQVHCDQPIELSFNNAGNWWGRSNCPYFNTSVDSDSVGVVDSHPYTQPYSAGQWPATAPNIVMPTDGMTITEDTIFCAGTYSLPNGVAVMASNVTLDCNNTTLLGNSSGYGLYFINRDGVTVRNCVITNYSHGMYLTSSSSNTLVNNTVYDNTDSGISLSSCSDSTLSGNTVYGNADGFWLESSLRNTLADNTVYGNSISGFNVDFSSDNNTFTGNTVYDNTDSGIRLGDSVENTIADNTLYNNTAYGVFIDSGSVDTVLVGNTVYDNGYGIHLHSASNSNITGNNITGNNGEGVVLQDSNTTRVYHNSIYDNNASLTQVTSNQPIELSYSSQGNWWGYSGCPYFTVGVDSNDAGVVDSHPYMLPYATGSWPTTTPVQATPTDGMNISQSTYFVVGNYSLTSGISVTGNNIVLDCCNSRLTGNASADGITLDLLFNVTVRNCLATNYTAGIRLAGSVYSTLEGNTLYNNTNSGIYLTSSNGTRLTGNTVYTNGQYGIGVDFSSSSNTLASNTAHHNVEGIYVGASSSNNILSNNSVYGNSADGIQLSTASGSRLTGNTVYNNSQYGVSLYYSSSNALTENTAYANGRKGITIYHSSSNNVTGNNLTENTEEGLRITNSSATLVWHNSVYGNAGGLGDLQVVSDQPIDLSYNGVGNYWGRSSCPYFVAGVDGNDASVVDSYSYNGSYLAGEWPTTPPECNITCVTPTDDMDIHADLTLCTGTYSLPNGVTVATDDVTLNCSNATLVGSGSGSGISVSEKTGVTIVNCVVYNYSTGIYLADADNSTVSNNTVYDNVNVAIEVQGTDNIILQGNSVSFSWNGIGLNEVYNSTISGNTVWNISDRSINLGGSSGDNVVSDNVIFNVSRGVMAENNFLENLIQYNNISSCGTGIELRNSSSLTVLGNRVEDCGGGIQLIGSSFNNTIQNNTFQNSTSGVILSESVSNTVTDNTVYGNSEGVSIDRSHNNTIMGNTVYNNSGDGVALEYSSGNNITGNNITGNTGASIDLVGSNSTLAWNNIVYGNNASGWQVVSDQPMELSYDGAGNWWGRSNCPYFNASADSNDAAVVDNHPYTQPYSTGQWPAAAPNIVLPTDGMNITEDSLLCPGVHSLPSGITIRASDINLDCNNAVLEGNESSVGINLGMDGVTVSRCSVVNYENGIYVSGDNNTLTDNTVYDNAIDGIVLGPASNNNLLTNNTLYNNAYRGIYLHTSSNHSHLENNRVYGNGGGITVQESNNNTLTGNTLYDNTGRAIDLSFSSNNAITGNIIYGNNGSTSVGLTSSSNNTITDNVIYGASGDGMRLGNSSYNNIIFENNISGNGDYGILLEQSNLSRIWHNSIYGNNPDGLPNWQVYSDQPLELSYNNQGNWWGKTGCPYFTAGLDSNDPGVVDSHPYMRYYATGEWPTLAPVGATATDGMTVNQSTYFVTGTYSLPNGITLGADDILLDCCGSILVGNRSSIGIGMDNSDGSTARHCTVTNYTDGISVGGSNNTLTGNTVYDNNRSGIHLSGSSNSNTLSDNTLYQNSFGVYVDYSVGNTLTNNTVYNNSRNGIDVSYGSTNNILTSNTAYDNIENGIELSRANNNTLTNNTAYNNTHDGIRIDESSNYSTLTGNMAYDNEGGGINLVSSSGNTLTANTAYDNQDSGISIGSSSSNNTLTDNAAYGNTGAGFWVGHSSGHTLAGNTAYSNLADGIRLDTSNSSTLSNNTLYDNGWSGVWLSASSNNNITGNTIYNNSIDGIKLDPSSNNNTLTDNTVYNNIQYGIILYSPDNRLTSNVVYSNTDDGVVLYFSSNNTLTGNTVYKNTDQGIWVHNSHNNTLTGNIVYNNSRDGISLGSSNNNILANNALYRNNQNGIRVHSSNNNTITGNIVYDNTWNGINLESSSSNNVTENNITGNNVQGIILYNSNTTVVYHNIVYGNNASGWQVVSDQPIELSYSSQGNWWGRSSCPYFTAGVDSNAANVVDSYSYNQSYSQGEWPSSPPICLGIPEVYYVYCDSPITLLENSTKQVSCWASIRDIDGCSNVSASLSSAILWHTSYSNESALDENNSHYSSVNCSTQCSDMAGNMTCSFNIQYYAEAGVWNASFNVTDGIYNASNYSLQAVTVENLTAMNIVTRVVNFSSSAGGAGMGVGTTSLQDIAIIIQNTGNTELNLLLSGSDMVCDTGSINVSNMRYNSTAGQDYDGMCPLTNSTSDTCSPVSSSLNLSKTMTGEPSTKIVYWKLRVPNEVISGYCNGSIDFTSTI